MTSTYSNFFTSGWKAKLTPRPFSHHPRDHHQQQHRTPSSSNTAPAAAIPSASGRNSTNAPAKIHEEPNTTSFLPPIIDISRERPHPYAYSNIRPRYDDDDDASDLDIDLLSDEGCYSGRAQMKQGLSAMQRDDPGPGYARPKRSSDSWSSQTPTLADHNSNSIHSSILPTATAATDADSPQKPPVNEKPETHKRRTSLLQVPSKFLNFITASGHRSERTSSSLAAASSSPLRNEVDDRGFARVNDNGGDKMKEERRHSTSIISVHLSIDAPGPEEQCADPFGSSPNSKSFFIDFTPNASPSPSQTRGLGQRYGHHHHHHHHHDNHKLHPIQQSFLSLTSSCSTGSSMVIPASAFAQKQNNYDSDKLPFPRGGGRLRSGRPTSTCSLPIRPTQSNTRRLSLGGWNSLNTPSRSPSIRSTSIPFAPSLLGATPNGDPRVRLPRAYKPTVSSSSTSSCSSIPSSARSGSPPLPHIRKDSRVLPQPINESDPGGRDADPGPGNGSGVLSLSANGPPDVDEDMYKDNDVSSASALAIIDAAANIDWRQFHDTDLLADGASHIGLDSEAGSRRASIAV